MKFLKALGTGLCFTLICLIVAPSAKADEWNRKTIVTFSAPVEVPGVGQHVLPAGTYVFKLMDSNANRHIVQIFNQDETQLLTTVLAMASFRHNVKDDQVITFRERPAGEPQAIKAFYYPGKQYGEFFVYQHARAVQLAATEEEPVLSTPVAMDTAKAEDLSTAPVEGVTPAGETVETATVVVPQPVEPVAAPAPESTPAPVEVASLPKTASNLSLFGLFGFLALGAGLMLTGILKRIA